MSTVLTVRDLRVRYTVSRGFVDVVHGVSLDINRGETTAIVGESGSGKTTLAMALCGLAPVYGGEVCFDGEQLKRDRRNRLSPDRKRVALMFQDPVGSLNPRMTIRKALAEPFRIHRAGSPEPDQEALRLLAMVGLGDDFADRYPHQLSGGQARRVGVARALALRPDILIADEPTAGLDVSIQGEVLNLLSRLQQEMGLGILMITHNLNVVRHVADQMAIMYLGRFIEQGNSQQISTKWPSCTWAASSSRAIHSKFSASRAIPTPRPCCRPIPVRIRTRNLARSNCSETYPVCCKGLRGANSIPVAPGHRRGAGVHSRT